MHLHHYNQGWSCIEMNLLSVRTKLVVKRVFFYFYKSLWEEIILAMICSIYGTSVWQLTMLLFIMLLQRVKDYSINKSVLFFVIFSLSSSHEDYNSYKTAAVFNSLIVQLNRCNSLDLLITNICCD